MLWILPVALVLACLQGCKTQDDATAAAEQMAATAATMQKYFAVLDTLIRDNEAAQRAQGYVTGVTLDAATLGQLEGIRLEIAQRAKLAREVGRIAAAFAEIANSDAAHDAAVAAGALNEQLVALKVGASSDAAAKALTIAVTSLVNAVRAHDEVKAAKLLEPVLVALCDLYDAEKPLYVSVADSYYETAASNAKALIERDQVATGSLYATSLKPFGLEPDVRAASLVKAARADLLQRVDDGRVRHERADRDVADALGEALHRMQVRVHVVASGRPMRVRVPPLTLEGVKIWISEIEAETGASL